MRSKSGQNDSEREVNTIPAPAGCSEPWWRSLGYGNIAQPMIGENASSLYPVSESEGGQRQWSCEDDNDGGSDSSADNVDDDNNNDDEDDDDGADDNDDEVEHPQSKVSSQSDGNYGQKYHKLQQTVYGFPTKNDGHLANAPQLELIGQSITCASNTIADPYHGGIMEAYGTQPLIHHQLVGMHYARMPLHLDMAQEPVYVNAKQYHGILRRRQMRAKAELQRKLVKVRKPYLHESRHQHAMRRARGTGGRFAKKASSDSSNLTDEKSTGSGAAPPVFPAGSSGSEPKSDSTRAWKSSNGDQEAKDSQREETPVAYTNSSVCGSNHIGRLATLYSSHLNKRPEEGEHPCQSWETIASNQAPQRALAMQ